MPIGLKAIIAIVAVVVVVIGAYAGITAITGSEQTPGLQGKLTVAGSTTVMPISQECARLFMEKNPGVRVSVSGGGSGHGVKAVGAGDIDIGAASRDVKTSEFEKFPDLKPVGIAKDSVAIIAHPSNTAVTDLTLEQASMVFAGVITNWKELGGADAPIHIVTREGGSGTREVFMKYVMEPYEKEIAATASVKPSNGDMRATVSKDELSIGYLSLGYVDVTLKALKINGITPSVETVLSGQYPIVRTLHLITKGSPSELEEAFIEFVLNDEGQKVVEDLGYIRMK